MLDRLRAELGDGIELDWRAFELRPDPVPMPDPNGDYLHQVWGASVHPMAVSPG